MHSRSVPRHVLSLLSPTGGSHKCRQTLIAQREVLHRSQPICCEAASSSGRPFEDFTNSAKSGAQRAGSAAIKTAKDAFEILDNSLRRTASQANARFDFTGKAQQAASQVSEQAKVVDSKVGFKRRLRNIATDVQRKWPTWQKKYAQFSKTSLGQVTCVAIIGFLIYTGLAFRILNLLFILWWLTPFLLVPFSRYFNAKAEEELRRRAEEQRRAQAARNPFFSSPFFSSGKGRGGSHSNSQNYGSPGSGGGPVIDVEYETIDDK